MTWSATSGGILVGLLPLLPAGAVVSLAAEVETERVDLHAPLLDATRGAVQPRPYGGFIQLVVHEAHLELWFFDDDRRREPVQWGHAVAIYRSPSHGREATILNPTTNGLALRSVDVIEGPFAFFARIELFREGESDASRVYEFSFTRGTGRT